ncbi:MAG TPA: hypothetical protein VD931_17620 [Baekduia sp.]|nr:hypothetical protein [Baekduia sp.]
MTDEKKPEHRCPSCDRLAAALMDVERILAVGHPYGEGCDDGLSCPQCRACLHARTALTPKPAEGEEQAK